MNTLGLTPSQLHSRRGLRDLANVHLPTLGAYHLAASAFLAAPPSKTSTSSARRADGVKSEESGAAGGLVAGVLSVAGAEGRIVVTVAAMLGVVGNLIVAGLICCPSRWPRTTTSFYLLHRAIADTCVQICQPLVVVTLVSGQHLWGCIFNPAMMQLGMLASTVFLSGLALDSYLTSIPR
ncbi:galanin receptor type 3-like [Eriocheir sinensis]|uniref:galanin receptor type 3-like n=1 Tax=Eriocheir sinensis TaxID=95602 RepID=UPI0021C633A2|nr:galanin receptor type 3-like [Eriocheir sinensis]